MASSLLVDIDRLDPSAVQFDRAFIYERLPHRFEFELLDGVLHFDRAAGVVVGYHDCRADEWWARGHVPGRPVFPGVLQLEAAAQLTAFATRYVDGCDEFIAYGGVEECRFRDLVTPPDRYLLISKILENRSRRVTSQTQGVVNGKLVFEARIIGMVVRG
jgi:3-hydroxyacyl-[acyl-carrier-protein] dehydratase